MGKTSIAEEIRREKAKEEFRQEYADELEAFRERVEGQIAWLKMHADNMDERTVEVVERCDTLASIIDSQFRASVQYAALKAKEGVHLTDGAITASQSIINALELWQNRPWWKRFLGVK